MSKTESAGFPSEPFEGLMRGRAAFAIATLGLVALATVAAPSAHAFTVVDASYHVIARAEQTITVATSNCPAFGETPPCVFSESSTTNNLVDEGQGSAIGMVSAGAVLLTTGDGRTNGAAFSGFDSSVGPNAFTYVGSVSAQDGSNGRGSGGPTTDEMGNARETTQIVTDAFGMTYASAQLDIIFEVEENTAYQLDLSRNLARSSPGLNQIAFARLNPLSASGETLPALFDEELAALEAASMLEGILLPGRYAFQVFSGGGGRDDFGASLVVVPEPVTSTLLLLGLGALAFKRRGH